MTIKRFEDIQGWQEARKLTNMVFAVSDKDQFAKSYRLRDQIQGAAISSMVNIAEGFDCDTDPEFIRFLSYAFRSTTEVQSHLYVAIDQHFISQEEFDSAGSCVILNLLQETGKSKNHHPHESVTSDLGL